MDGHEQNQLFKREKFVAIRMIIALYEHQGAFAYIHPLRSLSLSPVFSLLIFEL